MSRFVSNIKHHSSEAEEGELNLNVHPQLKVSSFPFTEPSQFPSQTDQRVSKHPSPPIPHPERYYDPYYHPWQDYYRRMNDEYMKSMHYQNNCGYYPERRENHQGNGARPDTNHYQNGHQRERELRRKENRERENQGRSKERKTNLNQNGGRQVPEEWEHHPNPHYYPPPPYYHPYMYPPPIMANHMPQPHMYPYPPPSPYGPSPPYPYEGEPLGPPVPMPPGSQDLHSGKRVQKNRNPTQVPEQCNSGVGGLQGERGGPHGQLAQKQRQNVYKMFPPPDHYMYGYGSPPMGYPGYPPPPPYMMYPPHPYDPRGEYHEREEMLRGSYRKQYIDNKKQKIRRALKQIGNPQKQEMLETIDIILKFDKKNEEESGPERQKRESDSQQGGLGARQRCYNRHLLKVDKWLSSEDEKVSHIWRNFISNFQLQNLKQRIQEAKNYSRSSSSGSTSESKRLINRLLISGHHRIF